MPSTTALRMRRRCFHARTLRTVLLCVSALQLSLAVGLSTNVHAATPKFLSTNTSIHQNVECTSKSAADLPSSLPVFARAYCEVRFKKLETITVLTCAQTKICLYHSGGIKQPFLMVALKCIQVPPLLLLRVRPSVTMRP